MSSLTIGICVRGDEPNLGNLLQNILRKQDLPADVEILIVCTDLSRGTMDRVISFAHQDPRVKALFQPPRSGKASAVNRILDHAEGEKILFASADGLPDDGCFQRLISHLEDQRVGIVCARVVPDNKPTTTIGRLVRLLWDHHDRMFKYLNHAGLLRHANELFCIRKGIVDRVPEDIVNDDAYMSLAARLRGWLILYDPESKWTTGGPKTLLEYFQQRHRIVFGHYQIKRRTGQFPQYLAYFLLLRTSKVLRLIFQQVLEQRGLLVPLIAFIIEILAHTSAVVDTIVGKSHTPWKALVTTKKLEA